MNRKIIILLILMTSLLFCLNMCGTPAYAADETLIVKAVWLDGDTLKIDVTDINGVKSSLALKLSDYVTDSTNSEYISIQAVDLAGNQSSVIQIKNPYYVESADKIDEIPTITVEIMATEQSTSAVSNGENPFTPDGSGTVMDNAYDGDGKEFFTVKTEDGNVFYLIIDRQRSSDNVYLLNAVSEDDLISLAEKNGKVIPTTEAVITQTQTTTVSAPEPQIKNKSGGLNSGTIIFVIIAVIGVGGAAYYFKIYKGKTKSPDNDNDDDEEESDDKMEESDEREYDDYNNEDGDADE